MNLEDDRSSHVRWKIISILYIVKLLVDCFPSAALFCHHSRPGAFLKAAEIFAPKRTVRSRLKFHPLTCHPDVDGGCADIYAFHKFVSKL